MWSTHTIQLIRAACDEDLARIGDITSGLLSAPHSETTAAVVPRSGGVICGLALAHEICGAFNEAIGVELRVEPARDGAVQDGDSVQAGDVVATLRGPNAAVLAVERTLLNFLGRMSGVATLTRK